MNIEDIKKELATLSVRSDLSESEIRHREQLKVLLGALEDAAQNPRAPEDGKEGDKMFPSAYVSELRDEAKKNRMRAREIEAEKALLEAKLGSIDLDDYQKLQAERAEQIKLQEQAEIERRKKEGEFDSLLAEARKTGEEALVAKSTEYEQSVSQLQEQINMLRSENSKLFFADQFNTAIADAKLEINDHEGVRLRLEREQVIEMDENGRKRIVLKDRTGEIMLDESGKELTLADRLKQLRDDEITSYMFKTNRKSVGSYTTPTTKAHVENEIEYFDTRSPNYSATEQQRIYSEDVNRYNRLLATAMNM